MNLPTWLFQSLLIAPIIMQISTANKKSTTKMKSVKRKSILLAGSKPTKTALKVIEKLNAEKCNVYSKNKLFGETMMCKKLKNMNAYWRTNKGCYKTQGEKRSLVSAKYCNFGQQIYYYASYGSKCGIFWKKKKLNDITFQNMNQCKVSQERNISAIKDAAKHILILYPLSPKNDRCKVIHKSDRIFAKSVKCSKFVRRYYLRQPNGCFICVKNRRKKTAITNCNTGRETPKVYNEGQGCVYTWNESEKLKIYFPTMEECVKYYRSANNVRKWKSSTPPLTTLGHIETQSERLATKKESTTTRTSKTSTSTTTALSTMTVQETKTTPIHKTRSPNDYYIKRNEATDIFHACCQKFHPLVFSDKCLNADVCTYHVGADRALLAFTKYIKKWTDFKPLDRTLAPDGSCAIAMLPQYFMCAANEGDHRACCQRLFVPQDCLAFCNPREANWPTWKDGLFHLYKKCHVYISKMFGCMWQRLVRYQGEDYRINYDVE